MPPVLLTVANPSSFVNRFVSCDGFHESLVVLGGIASVDYHPESFRRLERRQLHVLRMPFFDPERPPLRAAMSREVVVFDTSEQKKSVCFLLNQIEPMR